MNFADGDYYDSSPDITGDTLPGYDISLEGESDTAYFYYSINGGTSWIAIDTAPNVAYDTATSSYDWSCSWDSAQAPDQVVLFKVETTIADWAGNFTDLSDSTSETVNNPRADVRVTTYREAERGEELLIQASPDEETDVAAVEFFYTIDDPNSDTARWTPMTAVDTSRNTDTNMTEGNYAFRWDTSRQPALSDFFDTRCNCFADSLCVTVVGLAWDDDCGRSGDDWPYDLTDSDTFSAAIADDRYITVCVKDTTAPKITLTQIHYTNDCDYEDTLVLPEEAEDMIISGLVDITARSESIDDLNTGSAYVTFMYSKDGNTWDTIDMDPIHTYDNDSVDTMWALMNWDTRAPKLDGEYYVGIKATDVFGNHTEEVYPFKLRIDNIAPTNADLTLKGSYTDSTQSNILERGDLVLLSATVTGAEQNDVTQATFYYDTHANIPHAWVQIGDVDDNFPYSVNWRVPKELMVGTDYDIRVVVSDRVGCTAEDIVTMRMEDNYANTLITKIETKCGFYGNSIGDCEDVNGARISGVVILTASVDDEVKRVIFKYHRVDTTDTTGWTTAADEGRTSDDTTTWFIMADWDTTGLPEGTYELAAIGTDDLNHEDTNPQVITVIIDHNADFTITSSNLKDKDVVGFADNADGSENSNATIDLIAALNVTDNDLQKDTAGRYSSVQFGFKLCADLDAETSSWNWIDATPTYDSLTGRFSLGVTRGMFTGAGGELDNCCYDFAVKIKDKACNEDYRVMVESVSVDNLDPLACITAIGGDMTLDQPVDVSDSDAVKIRVTATDLCTNIENLQFQLATTLEATTGGTVPIDIVWVIDSSVSMGPYQAAIANNADTFVQILIANNADYRLGVVDFSNISFPKNTDGSNGAPDIGAGQWTTDATTFATMVTSVGASGGITENGLSALNATLNHYGYRLGGTRVFILVTDEDSDDYSPALEQSTIAAMQNNGVTVYGILNSADDNPYPNVIAQTGGLVGDITTSDWSGTLSAIGTAIIQQVVTDWQDIDVDISTDTEPASYTITWNTAGLPEGSYYLRVIATDSVGNISNGDGCIREVVVKDTLPPIATICGYDDFQLDVDHENISNIYVDAIYAVAYCDDAAEVQFQYSQDTGTTWINIGRATNPIEPGDAPNIPGRDAYSLWKVTWTSNSRPAAGTYWLRALAKDESGNRDVSLAPITEITVDAEGNVTVADVTSVVLDDISLKANLIDNETIQITAQIYGDDAPLRTVLVVVEDAANNVTEEIIQLYPKPGDPYQNVYVGVTTLDLLTIIFGGQVTIFTCGTDNFGYAGATSEHKYTKLTIYPVTGALGTNGSVESGDGKDNDQDTYIDEQGEANNIVVTIPGNSVTSNGGLLMLPTITPITDADQLRYLKPLAQAYDLQLLNATGFNRGYEPEVKFIYTLASLETELGRSIDTQTELSVRYWDRNTEEWVDTGLFNINIDETTITFNVMNSGNFNNIYTIVWKRASIIHGVVFGQYDNLDFTVTEKTYRDDPDHIHYVTTNGGDCGDTKNFDAIQVVLAESSTVNWAELSIDGLPVANTDYIRNLRKVNRLNGFTYSLLAADLNSDTTGLLDVDRLQEGRHELRVDVRDNFGKYYTATYTFKIDNTAPMTEIVGGALESGITYFDPQTSTLDVVFVDQGAGIDFSTLFSEQGETTVWMDIFKIIQPGAGDQGNVVNHQRKTLLVTTSIDGLTREYSDNYSNDGDHSNDNWQTFDQTTGFTNHQAYRLSYKFNEGTMKDGDTFQVALYGSKNPTQVIDNYNEWYLDQLTYLFENPEEGLTYLLSGGADSCCLVLAMHTEQYDLLDTHYPDSTTWTPNDPFTGYYEGFNLPDALNNCRFVNYAVRNFVVDMTAPTITSNLGGIGEVITTNGEPINITATASDQGAGLKSLVIVAVGAKNTLSSTNGVLTIDHPLGKYVVTITATDKVGRTTIERKVFLAVPEMASSVSDGGTVLSGQAITISCGDIADTTRVTLKLDGKSVPASQYEVTPTGITYTPTDLSVGEHTLIVLVDGQQAYSLRFITEAATLSFGDAHNYPNPFDGSTIITYQMTKTARVTIKIYDLAGDIIKTLCENETHAP
ncbi:VWA domain-containing protein, partial [Patescibacteria group bacterium]|nr:VWA domain-containing protein [Patescibacteria group bacterium]